MIQIKHSLPTLLLIPKLFPSLGVGRYLTEFIPRTRPSTSEVLSSLRPPPSSSCWLHCPAAAGVVLSYLIPQARLKPQTTQGEPARSEHRQLGKLTQGHAKPVSISTCLLDNALILSFICCPEISVTTCGTICPTGATTPFLVILTPYYS